MNLLPLVVGASLVFAATPQQAYSAKPRRADLVVARGDVGVARGRLSVTFKVKNSGTKKASKSTAAISTVIEGKVAVLSKAPVTMLRAGHSIAGKTTFTLPKALKRGAHEINLCVDHGRSVPENSESNNCLDLGTYSRGKVTDPLEALPIPRPIDVPAAAPAPGGTSPQVPTPGAPTIAASTVPTDPVARHTGEISNVGDSWVFVPDTYDSSNQTPIRLLVWMHGCGGISQYELGDATVGANQSYIGMAPTGADGACWDVKSSPAAVLAQIAALETHFNIDRRRVVLGGYSSGGDMAYRMAIDHPATFAGLLVENTTPFRDSGASNAAALAATPKFPIVHLAHFQDTTYPIATVRTETDQLVGDGFALRRIEVDGSHYDAPGAMAGGHAVPGTAADVATYLLPSMNEDWQAPVG